jgi:hypothetical protein
MTYRIGNELECLRQARRSIGLIRKRLLNPTPKVLENCVPHFKVAIQCLTAVQDQLASDVAIAFGREALRMEIAELRYELSQVNALMKNAAAFYDGLAQLLGIEQENSVRYSMAGALAAPAAPTLQLEG